MNNSIHFQGPCRKPIYAPQKTAVLDVLVNGDALAMQYILGLADAADNQGLIGLDIDCRYLQLSSLFLALNPLSLDSFL